MEKHYLTVLPRRENGNALFLILIAVALFAALSYAITQSGRGGSGGISRETMGLKASQVMQAVTALQVDFTRMALSGTASTSITMSTPDCGTPGSGFECTAGATCLFAPDGGGATVPTLPSGIEGVAGVAYEACYTPVATGWSSEGIGTAAPDIMYSIDDVSEAFCTAVNALVGITGIPKDAVNGDFHLEDAGGVIDGHHVYCMEWPNMVVYSYIHILEAR